MLSWLGLPMLSLLRIMSPLLLRPLNCVLLLMLMPLLLSWVQLLQCGGRVPSVVVDACASSSAVWLLLLEVHVVLCFPPFLLVLRQLLFLMPLFLSL